MVNPDYIHYGHFDPQICDIWNIMSKIPFNVKGNYESKFPVVAQSQGNCISKNAGGIPVDSWGSPRYHSNQKVSCWDQWRSDELADVLCPWEAFKLSWWFFGPNQFAGNWSQKFDINSLTFKWIPIKQCPSLLGISVTWNYLLPFVKQCGLWW